jgi:hypothetical protein
MYAPSLNIALQDRWWIPLPVRAAYNVENDTITPGDYADRGAVDLHQLAADGNTRHLLAIARTVRQSNLTRRIDDVLWEATRDKVHNTTSPATRMRAHLTRIGIRDGRDLPPDIELHVLQTLPLPRWLSHTLTGGVTPPVRHSDVTSLLDEIAAANTTGDTAARLRSPNLDVRSFLDSNEPLWAYCALHEHAPWLDGVAAELLDNGSTPGDILDVLAALQPSSNTPADANPDTTSPTPRPHTATADTSEDR